ncbi:hypothetical protein WDU94_012304 [Cyamophila willieti]
MHTMLKSHRIPIMLQVKELLEANKTIKENKVKDDSKDMDSIINEMNEREKRAKNVIIFDIQENDSTDVQERVEHDKSKVNAILQNLQLPILSQNSRIRRLGKKSSTSRPIIVTMENKFHAISVLKKAREANKKNIKKDMTPIQREKMKSLQEKLQKKKDEGDTNWTIRYIKGTPQLWKISGEQQEDQRKNHTKDN